MLVAYDTRNAGGQRTVDGTMLNAVLVMMLATSNLCAVLMERFTPRMLKKATMGDEGSMKTILPARFRRCILLISSVALSVLPGLP